LDYVAVKLPKWPFDKFIYAKRELGTQMKATGEVKAIADTFEAALLKAVRGAEIGLYDLNLPRLKALSDHQIYHLLHEVTDERLFVVYEAILRGISIEEIHSVTQIDRWFLYKLAGIDEKTATMPYVYKMVDTCGGEFEAKTPYFYSISGNGENEALSVIGKSQKTRIVVLGSGPIRIGQGIEFDYACVHCVRTLKELGYEVIVINNNPETVSTDFDTADRLYFEPVSIDDVMSIIEMEKPVGVIVSFGGGTAIKLAKKLHERGVNIIGISADSIDICEDRDRFNRFLDQLKLKQPKGFCVMTKEEALSAAQCLGYPVLMRPSYVLGGQNMIIAFSAEDIDEYMDVMLRQKQDNPVLIDKYLSGREIEVDAICDGEDILIPGIMEHIERSGIHSGDSIAVYPAVHIDDQMAEKILDSTKKICVALNVKGLINIQYIVVDEELYVIEVNPRASRTVPYLSKVTGIPICELATKASIGQRLSDLGYGNGIYKVPPYTAVKVPVFSFEKLADLDTHLGPEMKSTGEVLGIGKTLKEALYKGLIAAGYKMKQKGGVLITVRDSDKGEIAEIAKKFHSLEFSLYATSGTAAAISYAGLPCRIVHKINENIYDNAMTILESGRISYIISTSRRARNPADDDVKIRRKACLLGIPCLTSLDTANALADSLLSRYSEINTELVNINEMREKRMKLEFTKMHGCGNDYIYINCFEREINCPESLSPALSDRHYGIGGDGVVLICKSDICDARMRMFNLDGSEGKMCGNAIRCVAKYLYDNGIVKKNPITIETLSGIKTIQVNTQNGLVCSAKVDMGKAELEPSKIPVRLPGQSIVNVPVEIGGETYHITCVSMGNPHAVVFCDEIDNLNIGEIGPLFEYNELFPERVNTEFVKVIDRSTIKMRVWERGSGETLACGTGACAAAVAAVLNGYCDKGRDIRVLLLGGELIINYTDETVFMTGDCSKVFEGVVEI
jgi:carbamoyl-phosphate synthase large subunit